LTRSCFAIATCLAIARFFATTLKGEMIVITKLINKLERRNICQSMFARLIQIISKLTFDPDFAVPHGHEFSVQHTFAETAVAILTNLVL